MEAIVSHYQILQELGRGGMGVVYKALDTALQRFVALKFVTPQLPASAQGTERLLREARAASALNHPHVVTIYEVGEHQGNLFIATEFVEGKTLDQLIRPQGLEVELAVHCATQIADALRAAHALGIVHRDIKPQNVMVTPENRVKILDFGLAQRATVQGNVTRTGTLAGTLRYMSPEQIQGHPVDRRSDIFSLGVVLYEMLSGRAPFEGEYEVAYLYSLLNTEPLPLHELARHVSPDLSALVARCLSKTPDDRYQDCGELLEALSLVKMGGLAETRAAPELHVALPFTSRAAETVPVTPPVGRSGSFTAFSDLLERVLRGEGRTLFVGGEPGVGKTHLATAFMEEARSRGCLTLWGRCLSQEAGLPYHPFASALGSYFGTSGQRELERLSARAARQGINLAGRSASIKAFLKFSADPISIQNKEQIWDALLMLLRVMGSESPVTLVLDDIHWIDAESLGLFCFLARNIGSLPILLLGMYRSEALAIDADESLAAIAAPVRQLKIEGAAGDMTLNRLTREETAQLLGQILGDKQIDPRVTNRLYGITAGNPLFVSELTNLMKSTGAIELVDGTWRLAANAGSMGIPDRVRDVIAQRLDCLVSEEREMLEIASCDGDHFGSDTLAACLQINRLSLLKRLQKLEKDHALIRHDKNSYRFDHPLIRQVLYESLLPELREEYHRMIAASLIQRFGSETHAAARIGHHLLASGQQAPALEYLVRAGAYARSLFANEEASEHYSKASTILSGQTSAPSPFRLQVEEGLGDIASDAGRTGEAATHYDAMLQVARGLSDKRGEIEALRKMSNMHRMLGKFPEAIALCTEALAMARSSGLSDRETECLNTLAFVHAARGEYGRTIDFSEQALGIARGKADVRATATSLSNLGVAEVHTGEYRSAVTHLTEAKSLQEYIGDRKGLAFTLNSLALVNHRLARYDTALKDAQASLALKQSLADAASMPGTVNVIGDLYRDSGNLEAAVEHHNWSLALAREQNNRGAQCDNLRDLGTDYLLKGDVNEARRYLHDVLAIARMYGYTWYETRSNITLGELSLKTGAIHEAEGFSQRGLELARRMNARELMIEAGWKQALVVNAQGKRHDAAALLREAIASAESSGHLIFLWQMYADLGRILQEADETDDARTAWEKGRSLVRTIAGELHDDTIRRSFLAMAGEPEA